MMMKTWLYDAILYVYALSLLFFFFDFLKGNRSAKRLGTGFLFFVWLLLTVHLGALLWQEGVQDALYTEAISLLIFAWLLTGLSLVMERIFKVELFGFLISLLGFAVLLLHLFRSWQPDAISLQEDVAASLLLTHVLLAVASYVCFAAAAVLSGMHLFVHRRLKEKRWSPGMKRMPSLIQTELYAYRLVVAGVLLLLAALAPGIAWISTQGSISLLLDIKVLISLLLLAVYLTIVVLRATSKAAGTRLACWNLAGFGLVVLNALAVNNLSAFHAWEWM